MKGKEGGLSKGVGGGDSERQTVDVSSNDKNYSHIFRSVLLSPSVSNLFASCLKLCVN